MEEINEMHAKKDNDQHKKKFILWKDKTDKPLAILMKRRKEKRQIKKIRDAKVIS
jgi:hypothetical protein